MKTRAFSLLELAIVISIIAVIAAFAVPAVATMLNGTILNQASQTLTAELTLARQFATSRNRAVEVRFLWFRDPEIPADSGGFHGIQLMEVQPSGVSVPLGKVELFPNAVALCADSRSSLLDPAGTPPQVPRLPVASTDPSLPRGINQNYQIVSFRFLPDGSTTLAASQNWFATIISSKDQNKGGTQLPANFFTLQIDPVNGSTRGFRPNLP